jgi:hypothetical protein
MGKSAYCSILMAFVSVTSFSQDLPVEGDVVMLNPKVKADFCEDLIVELSPPKPELGIRYNNALLRAGECRVDIVYRVTTEGKVDEVYPSTKDNLCSFLSEPSIISVNNGVFNKPKKNRYCYTEFVFEINE